MTGPTPWHQQILVHERVFPASVANLPNGQLPASALVPVNDSNGKPIGQLCPEAARAWAAMCVAAHAAGIYLGGTDTYRPLGEQQRLWDTRYDHTDHGNGSRTCGGDKRYLKPHCATCACPGTSNHGKAIAVDDDSLDESGPGLEWLEWNAQRFGFQWEVPSEVWHLQYWAGDAIPQAVLDYEGDDVTDQDKQDIIDAVNAHVDARVNQVADDLATNLGARLTKIDGEVTAIKAKLGT